MSLSATVAAAATCSATWRIAWSPGWVVAPDAPSSSASCSSRNARSRSSRIFSAGRLPVSRLGGAVSMTGTLCMMVSRVER